MAAKSLPLDNANHCFIFLYAFPTCTYSMCVALGLKMGKYFDCTAFCMWKTNASNCTHACQPNQSRASDHWENLGRRYIFY